MLERRSVVLRDNKGVTRSVLTSNPDQVYIELLADCPQRYAILMTPHQGFNQGSDYLIEVTDDGGNISFRNLYGTTPDWANESTDWSTAVAQHGATLIATHEMSF